MVMNKYFMFLLMATLPACQLIKNTSYQQPISGESGSLFIYTPDTEQINADSVSISIDNTSAGDVSENRPLQLSASTGWHKLAVHRRSALGAREELAKFDMLVEKDIIYYVRYAKTVDAAVRVMTGSSVFGVVDENIGRQMQ